jgi:hypothetical protein
MPVVTDSSDVMALLVSPCKVRPAALPEGDVARPVGVAGLETSP